MYVHHIAITVNNLEESLKFYTEVFGFERLEQFEKGNSRFAYLSLEGFQLELWQFSPVKAASDLDALDQIGIRHLAFAVRNIDEAIANAEKYNVVFPEPQMGASGHRYSLGSDCNGIALELLEVK